MTMRGRKTEVKCGACRKPARGGFVWHCLLCNMILCGKCRKMRCPHKKAEATGVRGKSLIEKMMFIDGNMMLVDSRERKCRDGSAIRTETIRRPSREERRLINMAFTHSVSGKGRSR